MSQRKQEQDILWNLENIKKIDIHFILCYNS